MEPVTTAGLWLGLAAGVITDDMPGGAPPWAGGRAELVLDDPFSVELSGDLAPDLGERGHSYRPLIDQLGRDPTRQGELSPARGRVALTPKFAPFRGQLYLPAHATFDVHLFAGPGLVWTRDDLAVLDKLLDPTALATERQIHPTMELGFGTAVRLSDRVRVFAENRFIAYVEALESTQLETRTRMSPGLGIRVHPGPTRSAVSTERSHLAE